MEERLNKYLSRMGICSRREADRMIEEGRVLVDGRRASMGEKVTEGQSVLFDGRPVLSGKEKEPRPILLAVNKPRGIVCTTSDKDRAENIVEFLHYPERIYPVGRLDKDSEGLLLMTNQGDLVNKIMRSGNAHEKEYIVTIDRDVTDGFLRRMSAGIYLEELKVRTRPCKVKWLDDRRFSIILTQGLNRQIRRMCQACGCRVERLVRVRIMNIGLGSLKEGQSREISGKEYEELLRLLSGSSSLPVKQQL
ncbi:pseudouridine synthase [Lacrimispora sp. 210928-DFI.3.58]|uniref:pseudouridine synthase n=1 Tax=Lacrimispora sp. 210928-DFI.3.58 TaxID=2883214 RepID=UPI001D092565|nr:pseudouridine synthase [Lacrimispora sp. 210928-DFI.3.58]MCB7318224.1 pseudouridine synthase [Lacrimispora sp. 210928-DFI.3.58]